MSGSVLVSRIKGCYEGSCEGQVCCLKASIRLSEFIRCIALLLVQVDNPLKRHGRPEKHCGSPEGIALVAEDHKSHEGHIEGKRKKGQRTHGSHVNAYWRRSPDEKSPDVKEAVDGHVRDAGNDCRYCRPEKGSLA